MHTKLFKRSCKTKRSKKKAANWNGYDPAQSNLLRPGCHRLEQSRPSYAGFVMESGGIWFSNIVAKVTF